MQMAEASMAVSWAQAGQIAYLIAETNRDRKKRPQPFKVEDFNPMAGIVKRRKPKPPKVPITVLKAFVRKR